MTKIIDREALAQGMANFANSKPGFDLCNYSTQAAYKSDYNQYKKYANKNRDYGYWGFKKLLDGLTEEQIIYAFRTAYSGRLSFNDNFELEYCTGQYYCTEYQHALNRVIEYMEEMIK